MVLSAELRGLRYALKQFLENPSKVDNQCKFKHHIELENKELKAVELTDWQCLRQRFMIVYRHKPSFQGL